VSAAALTAAAEVGNDEVAQAAAEASGPEARGVDGAMEMEALPYRGLAELAAAVKAAGVAPTAPSSQQRMRAGSEPRCQALPSMRRRKQAPVTKVVKRRGITVSVLPAAGRHYREAETSVSAAAFLQQREARLQRAAAP
jgi:hypothetical protein